MSDKIDTKPRTSDEFAMGENAALLCPECGDPWLHQTGIDVFVRHSEDDERGQHVDVDHNGSTYITENVKTSAGNPSSRRDGIRIQFSCEHCSGLDPFVELVIEQHKGNEFIHWEVLQ